MADVSKLRANINGVFETYDVKDPVARQTAEAAAARAESLGLSVVDGAINITYTEGE